MVKITKQKYLEALDIIERYYRQMRSNPVRLEKLKHGNKLISIKKGDFGDKYTVIEDPEVGDINIKDALYLESDLSGSRVHVSHINLNNYEYYTECDGQD